MIIEPSARLLFERFVEADAPALAGLLGDPSLTRNITSNGSTPERCLASAHKRIAWHNSGWDTLGYGVWALRARDAQLADSGRLLGWCGFAEPDDDAPDPEILYAVDAAFRGQGLASEAARHAIAWLFDRHAFGGVTAVISKRLNPGSVRVVRKLGFVDSGRMDFELFLSSRELADDVADYELWRLEHDSTIEFEQLLEQVAYRAGQLAAVTSNGAQHLRASLEEALRHRAGEAQRDKLVSLFREGQGDAFMDCFHLAR